MNKSYIEDAMNIPEFTKYLEKKYSKKVVRNSVRLYNKLKKKGEKIKEKRRK